MTRQDYIDQFDDEYEQRAAARAWDEGLKKICGDLDIVYGALVALGEDRDSVLKHIGMYMHNFLSSNREHGVNKAAIGHLIYLSIKPYILRRVQDYADAERWQFMPRQGDREEDRLIQMTEKEGEL